MKTKTRWKRRYPNIIGKRFFDGGEYSLGFFTVLKAWKCEEYRKILIKTDSGLKYKIPYCPWTKITDDEGQWWGKYYNEKPW